MRNQRKSWNLLLDQKRQMDKPEMSVEDELSQQQAAEEEEVMLHSSCPEFTTDWDTDRRDTARRVDPLGGVSCHRRRSFRMSAAQKVCRKALLESLKEAARLAQKEHQTKIAQKACEHALATRRMSIKIQAVMRGYLCRKNNWLCDFLKPSSKKTFHHSRQYSEITMSEFGDSVLSLDTLDWSPCGLNISNHHSPYKTENRFHASSSTATTCMESIFNPQDSLASTFTQESSDSPVRLPLRKLSPPPERTEAMIRHQRLQKGQKHSPTHKPPLTPKPPHERVSASPIGESPSDSSSPQVNLRPRMEPFLFALEPPISPGITDIRGNTSFSSVGSRDWPAKKPSRTVSPVRRREAA